MSDLASLIEHAIPEGRQSLENSYANLERVAAYCEAHYIQVKRKFFKLFSVLTFFVLRQATNKRLWKTPNDLRCNLWLALRIK